MQQAGQGQLPLRHAVAVFIGNGLEFYDFMTYAFFAVYIGRTFFPSGDPMLSLLASLGTFGVGFITRPLGALYFGPLADRIGRKPVMVASFTLMGFGIAGLCLTPSYARIGVAAPIFVLLFRLVQGFALGGEVGPSTAYMVEAAPPMRRGLFGSMQACTVDFSNAIAGIVGLVLSLLLSQQQLQDWGWRIAMGLGVLIVPFGLWMRSRLPESLPQPAPAATDAQAATLAAQPALRGIRPHLRVLLPGLVVICSLTIGGYTANYMGTYSMTTLQWSSTVAFSVVITTNIVSAICDATGGWLSDRFGRKPATLLPMGLLVAAILPAFWAIGHYRTLTALYSASIVMTILYALSSGAIFTAITEQLPAHLRSGSLATIYAFAVSIFGGTTQFTETWLIRATGSPLAPAYYWLCAAAAGLVAFALLPESAPVRHLRNT
ncbi:MAG TPA: MFS transporter [Steroidobacteraceae bacterium]|nr:MFS transporter [Steroidobacteraceae bacterium]